MFVTHLKFALFLFSPLYAVWQLATAEPVQYCKYGDAAHPNERVDFCVGAVLHRNVSTSSHDLLLSFTHTRHGGSKLGWTAIGLGEVMEGSPMFIVYGDPLSNEAPLVSIRVATGHHQPTSVTRSDVGGADLRVLEAAWVRETEKPETKDRDNFVARVHLICYSCALWPGNVLSAADISQPWLWAWNPNQDFPAYSFDAHLEMHAHHSTSGGFGNFYVDMTRAVNNVLGLVSLPPIRPGVATLGTSDTPAGPAKAFIMIMLSPSLHLHALLMGAAFFLLFPAGIIAMRSEARNAFTYHWILQLIGSIVIFCGMILGLRMRNSIDTAHQSIGIVVVVATAGQGILGWRHHMKLNKTGHRTWVSKAHILLGRSMMAAGWSNSVIGMMLYGHSIGPTSLVGIFGVLEVAGITFWIRRISDKKRSVQHDFDVPLKRDFDEEL